MKLQNKTYDILKCICTIILPACATFWLALSSIWDIPYGEPIGATLGAFNVFLGTLIGISCQQYNKDNNVEHDNL